MIQTTHIGFAGELRFDDETVLEEALDIIALKVFGDDKLRLEPEEVREVPYEDLFRHYRAYVPIEHLPSIITTFSVEPISLDPDNFPLVFKPPKREVTLDQSAP